MQKNIESENKAKVYKAALYARISKEDGDKIESDSIVNQRALIKEYIKDKSDIQLVSERADDGYSGTNFNRPDLNAMLEDARKGRINCIIVKDLSRFGRDYIEVGRHIRTLFPLLGLRFIAINDGYDSANGVSLSDNYILPIKNIINDAYSADMSKKIRSAKDTIRKNGKYEAGFAPFGYIKDPNDKHKLIVDRATEETVKDIFKWKIAGMSINAIANKLNSLGVKSPFEYKKSTGQSVATAFNANPTALWSPKAISRILENENYTGTLVQGKNTMLSHKIKKSVAKDESEWIRVENTHEAIIPKEEFALVAKLLKKDAKNADIYPFSGLLLCYNCKQNLVRTTSARKMRDNVIYHACVKKDAKDKRADCSAISRIKEKDLIASVTAALNTHIKNLLDVETVTDILEENAQNHTAAEKLQGQIDVKKSEAEVLAQRKVRLYSDYTDGKVTEEEYGIFRKSYDLQSAEIETVLENLRKELELANGKKNTQKEYYKDVARKYLGFTELTRDLLVRLIDKMIVYEGGRLEIIFNYADEYAQALEANAGGET